MPEFQLTEKFLSSHQYSHGNSYINSAMDGKNVSYPIVSWATKR